MTKEARMTKLEERVNFIDSLFGFLSSFVIKDRLTFASAISSLFTLATPSGQRIHY